MEEGGQAEARRNVSTYKTGQVWGGRLRRFAVGKTVSLTCSGCCPVMVAQAQQDANAAPQLGGQASQPQGSSAGRPRCGTGNCSECSRTLPVSSTCQCPPFQWDSVCVSFELRALMR